MGHSKNPESPWDPVPDPAPPAERIELLTAHMPALVDPLEPLEPETAFTETGRLRHDGWTPEKKRLFLERFAMCGVIADACRAADMSARAVYNLRDRDPLFAAGLDAARIKARGPLADEAYSRAVNGVVERIYKDGAVVAERHRYDNRLTMSVLGRLDARIDRAEERDSPHLAVAARWDEYLAALEEDRREDGLALLAPPAPEPEAAPASEEKREDRELRELHAPGASEADEDPHDVWNEGDVWWTNYPPPDGFDGEEEGRYGHPDYQRTLSPEEERAMEAMIAADDAEEAEAAAEQRALAEAQRCAFFGFARAQEPEEEASASDPTPAEAGKDPAPP